MKRQDRIEEVVRKNFNPEYLFILNESNKHRHSLDGDTHFLLVMVSSTFQGLSRIDRQRKVNQSLGQLFQEGLHALTMKLHSPQEWSQLPESEKDFQSPQCLGHGQ